MDYGMQVVGELRHLTALDLSMVFNATGAVASQMGPVELACTPLLSRVPPMKHTIHRFVPRYVWHELGVRLKVSHHDMSGRGVLCTMILQLAWTCNA